MLFFISLLSLVTVTFQQTYSVSLTFPFLIDNNRTNIKYIGSDFSNNFLVSLENAQGRRYDPTFTTYRNFTMPQAASLLVGVYKTINGFLSLNGSNLTSEGKMVTSLSNGGTTVRNYDYDSLVLLQSYIINDTVNYNYLVPLNISGQWQAFHLLYCKNGLKIAFDSVVTQISSFYISGEQNFDVQFNSQAFSVSSNTLTISVSVYLAQSGNKVYKASIDVDLQFNPSTNRFGLVGVSNQNMTMIYATSFQANSLHLSNSLLLIQNSATGSTAMYNTGTSSIGTVSGFMSNEILVFFFIFNKFYAIQSNGLVLISFSNATNTLSLFSLTIPLLTNLYDLSPGNPFVDPFYIVNQPYVYKAGKCTGQTLLSLGGICISYSCLIPHCSSCPFTPLTCGMCDTGYYSSALLLCLQGSTSNSSASSSSNSTNSSSTAIAANSSANNSNSASNSTNSSANFTNNSSFSSNATYSNGTFNGSGVPAGSNSSSQYQLVVFFVSQSLWQRFLAFLTQLLYISQLTISLPTARRIISPLFYYFGVFDDIYLYQFQDRTFGATMNAVFKEINAIEVEKWSCFTYENIINLFQGNYSEFDNFVNYQQEYLTYSWTDQEHIDLGSEGLISNSQNFFVSAIPIGFIMFIAFKMAFKLLFNYPLSMFIRKFDFWLFWPIIMFQGNIQQFSFFLTRQITNAFAFDVTHLLLKAGIIFFGFIVIVHSCSVYLLGYLFYKRLNHYFIDNNKNNLMGIALLIFQNGLKNLILGALQALLRPLPYSVSMCVLILVQLGSILIFLMAIRIKIYKSQIRIWLFVVLNLHKIVLLLLLLLDYHYVNLQSIQAAEQLILFLLVALFCLGIGVELVYQLKQLKVCLLKLLCKTFVKARKIKIEIHSPPLSKFLFGEARIRREDKKKRLRIRSGQALLPLARSSGEYCPTAFSLFSNKKKTRINRLKVSECRQDKLNRYNIYRVIGTSITASTASSLSSSNQFYKWTILKE